MNDQKSNYRTATRPVAQSRGDNLKDSCARLAQNSGTLASFGPVPTNALRAEQTPSEFDNALIDTTKKIFEASTT